MNNKVIFILPVNLYICQDLIATDISHDFWRWLFSVIPRGALMLTHTNSPMIYNAKVCNRKSQHYNATVFPAGKLLINLKIP